MIKCATWCGRGCTKAEHDAAQRKGKALAKRLGPGWKPRIWENLGWHYAAVSRCGRIKVHPSSGRRPSPFTAFLGAPGAGGRWFEHGSTPGLAVLAVIGKAKRDLAEMGAFLTKPPGVRP